MKIQGERPEAIVATHTPVAERARGNRADTSTAAATDRADRVQVSDDARLLNAALKAATSVPEASETAVERARQKLLSGELGQDSERLADKLIDHLLR